MQQPIQYAKKIMDILAGANDDCIDSTMKIVRALLEYRNSIISSSACEEQTPPFSEFRK